MMSLIVRSKIKEACEGMNVSGAVADALDNKVGQLLKDAVERAKANKRKTIMPQDI